MGSADLSHIQLRELLKSELAKRCQKNPSYSLRSFARSLELSPAFVSKLLKGDRPFTENTLQRIADKLALHPSQVAYYRGLLSGKEDFAQPNYRAIDLDRFQLISDWYHFAILELVTVEDFKATPLWIAKKLGISAHQASDAFERLLRLGYLQKTSRGKVVLVEEHNTTIGPEIVVAATKNQQTQILEKAILSFTETPIEARSQTSMTLAIPSGRVPEAKKLITEFRRRFCDILQRPGKRDSVYQLAVSFYPLTKGERP